MLAFVTRTHDIVQKPIQSCSSVGHGAYIIIILYCYVLLLQCLKIKSPLQSAFGIYYFVSHIIIMFTRYLYCRMTPLTLTPPPHTRTPRYPPAPGVGTYTRKLIHMRLLEFQCNNTVYYNAQAYYVRFSRFSFVPLPQQPPTSQLYCICIESLLLAATSHPQSFYNNGPYYSGALIKTCHVNTRNDHIPYNASII